VQLSFVELDARFRAALRTEVPRGPNTREAAVAVVMRRLDAPEVLLIKRAEHAADPWSGHIALPGGRHDPADQDSLATAIREAQEEVGLDLARTARYLGALDDVQALWRTQQIDMVIVPHVFVLESEVVLEPDPAEVEQVLWAPLAPMLRGESRATHSYRHEGQDLSFPAWRVGEHTVWGLTHRMLDSLFGLLRPPAES